MNRARIAAELVAIVRELVAADTFKCPNCGSKVLEQTGYCVKCKKKVKKGSRRTADEPSDALIDIIDDRVSNMEARLMSIRRSLDLLRKGPRYAPQMDNVNGDLNAIRGGAKALQMMIRRGR